MSAADKLATVIGLLRVEYMGAEQRAACIALLLEAQAEIERQLPKILSKDAREALIGPL